MATILFCLAILTGICAFGFLIAGMGMFADPEDQEIPSWLRWLPFEPIAFLLFWKKKPEGRRTMFVGMTFLVVTLVIVLVGFLLR